MLFKHSAACVQSAWKSSPSRLKSWCGPHGKLQDLKANFEACWQKNGSGRRSLNNGYSGRPVRIQASEHWLRMAYYWLHGGPALAPCCEHWHLWIGPMFLTSWHSWTGPMFLSYWQLHWHTVSPVLAWMLVLHWRKLHLAHMPTLDQCSCHSFRTLVHGSANAGVLPGTVAVVFTCHSAALSQKVSAAGL